MQCIVSSPLLCEAPREVCYFLVLSGGSRGDANDANSASGEVVRAPRVSLFRRFRAPPAVRA